MLEAQSSAARGRVVKVHDVKAAANSALPGVSRGRADVPAVATLYALPGDIMSTVTRGREPSVPAISALAAANKSPAHERDGPVPVAVPDVLQYTMRFSRVAMCPIPTLPK